MKKFVVVLLSLALLLGLAGCDPDKNGNQGTEDRRPLDDLKREEISAYLKSYGYMPDFTDVSKIDEDWLIHSFYYYMAPGAEYSEVLSIDNVEAAARTFINPQITMAREIDAEKYSDSFPFYWNEEHGVYMWSPSGGGGGSREYIISDAYELNGAYHITCVELKIVWDDEYIWEHGVIYSGGIQVGTAVFDQELNKSEYNYIWDFDTIPETAFVLRDSDKSGGDYFDGALFIIASKETASWTLAAGRPVLMSETETEKVYACRVSVFDNEDEYVDFLITLPKSMSVESSIIHDADFEGFPITQDTPSTYKPPYKVGELFAAIPYARDKSLKDIVAEYYDKIRLNMPEDEIPELLDSGEAVSALGNEIYYEIFKQGAIPVPADYQFSVLLNEEYVVRFRLWNSVYEPEVDLPRFLKIADTVRPVD